MVQLYSTFFVLASLVVAGISAPNAKRSVAQVQADLNDISAQVTNLDNAITAFPTTGGTLTQALVCNLVTTYWSEFNYDPSRCVIVIGDSFERRQFRFIVGYRYK